MSSNIYRTINSNHSLPIFENVLNRNFKPVVANQAWVSDITYIRTRSGWLYLAAVLDLYSRKVVGWAMAPTMPAELACISLQLAICQRCGYKVHINVDEEGLIKAIAYSAGNVHDSITSLPYLGEMNQRLMRTAPIKAKYTLIGSQSEVLKIGSSSALTEIAL
jgi:transposase InsO family protein